MKDSEPTNIVFSGRTTRYLGTQAAAEQAVEILRSIPKSFWPTKCSGSLTGKAKFSFKDPQSFIDRVPGPYPYRSDASIYKVKNLFDFSLMWSKGDEEWFQNHPTKPFNSFGFSSYAPDRVLTSSSVFEALKDAWLELCLAYRAVYGFVYLDRFRRHHWVRGHGRCLPRLHWITFLGREFRDDLDSQLASGVGGATIHLEREYAVIQLDAPPEQLIDPTPLEIDAIAQLDPDLFWRQGESRRRPKGPYRMPEFDWSEIVEAPN